MERIVIRHLKGSKANQTEVFATRDVREIILGRDPSANVKFDPDKDDLVSRIHAKINLDADDPTQVTLTDLNSRNGTFINKVKITGATPIQPGDVIQFGQGGPEVEFDIEPRPESIPRATRIVSSHEAKIPLATREGLAATVVPPTGTEPPRASVGRNTVERLIAQNQSNTRKYLVNGAAGLVGIVVLVAGFLAYQNARDKNTAQEEIDRVKREGEAAIAQMKAERPLTATEISQQYASSAVYIEAAWKLIDTQSGKQVYQQTFPFTKCVKPNKNNKACLEFANPIYFPAYVQLPDNSIEPWLTLDEHNYLNNLDASRKRLIRNDLQSHNLPIGSQHSGSGFTVTDGGFILTNRHVAATWQTRGDTPLPGVLCELRPAYTESRCQVIKELAERDAPSIEWVPSRPKILQLDGLSSLRGKLVEGRLDYLDVTFPKTKLRIPARLVRVSDTADVALIKIDVPQPVAPVKLDTDDNMQAGDIITVMGYPAVSPSTAVRSKSQDPMNRQDEWRIVPDPSITGGNIGKVIKGEATPAGGSAYDYFSEMGDVYQLTVNATGSGNSGGPVFNDKGEVIGIFTYGRSDPQGIQISFAVPIKHGRDIMDIQRVLK
jgi:serine protease Do